MENLNKTIARKILAVVDKGLVKGLGNPKEGEMCVEAAVCYAMGLPHGDNPICVGDEVRSFKIALNDSPWSSNKARTKGLRKLAIAQLGSNTLDQGKFTEKLGFRCMTKVLPVIVENAIEEDKDNEFVKKSKLDLPKLKNLAKQLRSAKDFESAKKLTEEIKGVYSAYASDSAYAYASASAYASTYAYASASTYASTYAYASASKNAPFVDKVLNLISKAGLDTLIEMKSQGVKWLDITQ